MDHSMQIHLIAGAAIVVVLLLIWFVQGLRIGRLKKKLARVKADFAVEQQTLEDAVNDSRAEAARMAGRLESAQAQAAELIDARQRITNLNGDVERLQAQYRAAAEHHAAEIEQLTAMRNEIQAQFKLLAGDVLKSSSEEFLKRANETFQSQKELTAAEIDKRSKAIEETVKPLGEKLASYEVLLKEIEKARTESYGSLSEALKATNAQQAEIRTVTARLVGALKASPKTRGRWGEEALRRVAELSGMTEHCDFETEYYVREMDDNRRPDMVIHVSGGREIIVDAKAPLSAYLDAIAATSEEEREQLLRKHARELRERMQDLSNKKYWEKLPGTVDCVVMFVPGDNFVSAAFEKDQTLFDDALKNRVLICTPTTFIALIKAISYGWRQEMVAQNAIEIGKLGKDLYARLSTLGDHIAKLGRGLETSVRTYNQMVGSIETKVMPQARKFNDLGVEGTAAPLPELSEIDLTARQPQDDRDLRLEGTESAD